MFLYFEENFSCSFVWIPTCSCSFVCLFPPPPPSGTRRREWRRGGRRRRGVALRWTTKTILNCFEVYNKSNLKLFWGEKQKQLSIALRWKTIVLRWTTTNLISRAQQVPDTCLLPDIFFNTRPDLIQFWKSSKSKSPKYRAHPKYLEIPNTPSNTRK